MVGALSDGQSVCNLAAVWLRHIAGTKCYMKGYLTMQLLRQKEMSA